MIKETQLKDVCNGQKYTDKDGILNVIPCTNNSLSVPLNTFKHDGLLYCSVCLHKNNTPRDLKQSIKINIGGK